MTENMSNQPTLDRLSSNFDHSYCLQFNLGLPSQHLLPVANNVTDANGADGQIIPTETTSEEVKCKTKRQGGESPGTSEQIKKSRGVEIRPNNRFAPLLVETVIPKGKYFYTCLANNKVGGILAKIDQKVSCRFCSTKSSRKNLKRHETYCSKNPQAQSFKCERCHSVYARMDSFKVHLKSCSSPKKVSLTCSYSECCAQFKTITSLIGHLRSVHNAAELDSQTLTFENEKDFLVWKEEEEARTFSYFPKRNGDKQRTDGDVMKLFYCQQHGSDKAHTKNGEPSRKTDRRNSKGRVKTGKTCISKMKATLHKNGSITVIYQPNHSHPLNASSLQFKPLSSESQNFIDAQLDAGVSPVVIKKQLKDKAVEKASILNENADKYKECYVSLKLIKERARRRRISKMYDDIFCIEDAGSQEIQESHREIQKKILKEYIEKLKLLVEDDGVPDNVLDKLNIDVYNAIKHAEVAMSNSVVMPVMDASKPFAPNQ